MLTWVKVSKHAIRHNIRSLHAHLKNGVSLMPVIKSNAYGHDMLGIAKLCDAEPRVTALCAVSLDEALRLKRQGIRKPIIILAIYDLKDTVALKEGIKHKIRFPLFSEQQARTLNTLASQIHAKVYMHLKIDTGTSRIGILAKEAAFFAHKMCSTYKHLTFEGVFSHFASSESDTDFTNQQLTEFHTVIAEFEKYGVPVPPVRHMACSAAMIKHTQTHLTSVRTGINLYGLHSIEKGDKLISLQPALSWYTTVIQVKKVPANTGVSYGRTYTTKRSTVIAVLPVGYYDGYPRALSNSAHVIIRGKRCPVRGRICMNMMMVDVTKVPGVKAGDIATLIGSSHGPTVTADDLAKLSHTINYEIVTRINESIPRVFV